jgi:hypothetical protein
MSVAYVSRYQKSIFNNKKIIEPRSRPAWLRSEPAAVEVPRRCCTMEEPCRGGVAPWRSRSVVLRRGGVTPWRSRAVVPRRRGAVVPRHRGAMVSCR